MRILKILIMSMIALCMVGCWTLSVNPLYTNKDLIFDKSLIGTWGDPTGESEETWTFDSSDQNSYRLVVRDTDIGQSNDDDPLEDCYARLDLDPRYDGALEAHLLKLGEYMFLDLFPEEPEIGNAIYLSHVIPAHSFMRVEIDGDVLRLAFFDSDWLKKVINENKFDIEYAERDDLHVLTAPTEKLQKLILGNIDDAFIEFDSCQRLK